MKALSKPQAPPYRSQQVSPRTSPNINKPALKTQQTPLLQAKNGANQLRKITQTPRDVPRKVQNESASIDEPSVQSAAAAAGLGKMQSRNVQVMKGGSTTDHPLATNFSNLRTVSYLDSAVPVRKIDVALKITDGGVSSQKNTQNKILSQANFSASDRRMTQTAVENFLAQRAGAHQQTYSLTQKAKQSLTGAKAVQEQISSKAGQTSTICGSSFAQTHDALAMQQHQAIDGTDSSDILDSVGDEVESDISYIVSNKQIPRSIHQFTNIFQQKQVLKPFKEMNTLDRILEEADKIQQTSHRMSDTLNLCSTQACTYTIKPITMVSKEGLSVGPSRRIFQQCQLSPTRIRDAFDLAKLPSKVLPTIEPGDITRSDLSRTSNRFSICSNILIGANDCSVPDILTNSSHESDHILRNSHFRQNGSLLSQDAPLFPSDHRDPDCLGQKITHNSCLQASCGQDSSSSSTSLLDGSSKCSCLNNSDTLKSQLQSKFMLNLETVLVQEVKLWSILQMLKGYAREYRSAQFYADVVTQCEEWWQMSRDQACLFDLYKIYRETATRKSIRKAVILESAVMVVAVFEAQFHKESMGKQAKKAMKKLARMFYSLHQNLLHVICLILQRMGLENCDANVWAVTLRDSIVQKMADIEGIQHGTQQILYMDEPQRNILMAKNSCLIIKGVKSLHKAMDEESKHQCILFTNVTFILQEIEKSHITRVKDILVQALSHDMQQLQQGKHSQVNHSSWQEYPLDDLECDESLQLPPSPVHAPNCPNTEVQNVHLSTINEDCSYCSQNQTNNNDTSAPVPPFLPPLAANSKKYTLVLDLDETLIHYVEPSFEESQLSSQYLQTDQAKYNQDDDENGGQFLVRPGVHKFLREMSQHYELVIFTAAMQDYADWVLDQLDIEHCISYRLYRQHAIQADQFFIKDLSRIGRDLSRTLIVDNVAENFQLQPDNGVFIRTWIDDPNDNALEELAPLLKEIVVKQIPDVRNALRIFRLQMMEQVQRGIMKPQLSLDYAYPTGVVENPEDESLRQVDQNRVSLQQVVRKR